MELEFNYVNFQMGTRLPTELSGHLSLFFITSVITTVSKTLKRSIAGGATVILAGNVINIMFSMLAVKLLVRGLGSSGYGLYSKIISPILLLQPLIIIFGERYYAFRHLSAYIAGENHSEASNVAMFLLLLRVSYGFLLTIIVYLCRDFLAAYIGHPELKGLVGLASLLIFLNGIYEIGYSFSIVEEREEYVVVSSVVLNIVKISALLIFLLTSNLDLYQALISIILGYVSSDIVLLFLSSLRVKPKPIHIGVYAGYFRSMLSYSLPIVFHVLAFNMCLEFPLMIFAHLGSNLENAVLRVSNRYFKILGTVGSALTLSMIPKISAEESQEVRLSVIRESIPYFGYVGSLLSAFMIGLPRSLLSIISAAYINYWTVIAIMGLSMIFTIFIPLRTLLVVNSGKSLILIGLSQLLYTVALSYLLSRSLILISAVYPLLYALYLLLTAIPLSRHISLGFILKFASISLEAALIPALIGQVMDVFLVKYQSYFPFYSLIVVFIPFLALLIFIIHVNVYVCLKGLAPQKIVNMYTAVNLPSKLKMIIVELLKTIIVGFEDTKDL